MDTLSSFSSWVRAVVNTLIGVLSGFYIREYLKGQDVSIALTSVIRILVALTKATELLLGKLVSSTPLIRRVLLGMHFIEGYWLEKFVLLPGQERDLSYALMKISFVEKGYVVKGETFNRNAESNGTFHSNYSEYSDFTLKYVYEGITSETWVNHTGNCEFKFMATGKFPTKLIGTINNSVLNVTERIMAERIPRRKARNLNNQTEKEKLLREFINANEYT